MTYLHGLNLDYENRLRTSVLQTRVLLMKQSGQALVEALISMLILIVLWVGVGWLGRIQDLALHASHAARYSAFTATRHNTDTPEVPVFSGFFHHSGNRWMDLRGQALQASIYPSVELVFNRHAPLSTDLQIGGSNPGTAQLRADWETADKGVLTAEVHLIPTVLLSTGQSDTSLLRLGQFEVAYPHVRRHTAIMTGAGHSSSDLAAADRIANSALAWSEPVNQSYRLGRRVASVASQIDQAWNRPAPVFDWLHPWSEYVPQHHLRSLP